MSFSGQMSNLMVVPEILGSKLDDIILVVMRAHKRDVVHVGRQGPHEIPLTKRLSDV